MVLVILFLFFLQMSSEQSHTILESNQGENFVQG